MRTTSKLLVTALTSAMLAVGCTKSGGGGGAATGGGGGDTTTGANIYGLVTSSNTAGSYSVQGKMGLTSPSAKKSGGFRKAGDLYSMALSGCTVTAEDLVTGAVVATTTSATDGTYTLTGVEDGETYKVIATCGATKLSLVSTADTVSTASKTPAATNPLSTLIAARVIQAIFDTLDSQLGSLPASIATTLKARILEEVVPTLVEMISSEIEEAVASGAMEAPTADEATTVAASVDAATETTNTDLDTAVTNYEAAKPMPPAVDQAITGGMANSEVAVMCSSSNPAASALTCTKAITKLMYTALSFPVIIKLSGGAFGTTTCDSAGIGVDLPNGNYADVHNFINTLPAGSLCYVEPLIGRPDRNQNTKDGGKDGGPMFAETADMNGDSTVDVGYLTEIGTAMYGGYRYTISDINKFIFGRDAGTGAGMDARLIATSQGWSETLHRPTSNIYYKGASGWTMVDTTGFNENFNWGIWAIGGCIADGWAFNSSGTLSGSSESCTNVAGYQTLVTNLGASDFTTDPVLGKKYYGPVPTQEQLDDYFDNGRMHLDYNPTGEKEFHVLFSQFPVWERDINGVRVRVCDDGDPTTICGDELGNQLDVRVNVTLGAKLADGSRAITAITRSATGEFYMQPVWDQTGFTGVFQFIRAADGMFMRDEFFQMRAIKVILTNTECNANGLPTTGNGCAAQKVYSVKMNWGQNGISYSALSTTAVNVEMDGDTNTTGDVVPVQQQVKQNFTQSNDGNWHAPHVAYGTWENMQDITVSMTDDGTNPPTISAGTSYKVSVFWNCSGSSCTDGGYYLLDSNDHPLTSTNIANYCTNNPSNCISSGYWDQTANNGNGQWTNVSTYKLTSASFGTTQLDGSGTDDVTWASDVAMYMVASGPVPNGASKCSMEPYFVDGNANGTLDCNVADNATANNDVSFSNEWQAQQYVSQHAGAQYIHNNNGYSFSDPAGAKKLMTTAFQGWFDGAHTIDSTTQVDALQGLALIWLYFEEGGGQGGSQIEDSTAPSGAKFTTFIPKMDGGGGGNDESLIWFNDAFGSALTTFKRP